MNNIDSILKKQIEIIKPNKEILEKIKNISEEISNKLKIKLKDKKIEAEIFIGGSLAKDTMIKTDDNIYDIDLFVRFNKKYNDTISRILEGLVEEKTNKIHGSRDYFQIKKNNIIVEIIPVIKIIKPNEAKNVTDLSYFHVKYVLNKINKKKKLSDEIRLAKSFSHSNDSYGAESYIKGFSGYALELLIIHYGSFLKFIKKIAELKENEKLIIDDNKLYKKKSDVLRELNESKLNSPIILIDPTFKERNALSGLGLETFIKFKKSCKEFLKNPKIDAFIKKDLALEYSKYSNLIKLIISTTKQKGDIAGTKSRKFYNFFISSLGKEFLIKKSDFYYDEEKNISIFYLVLDKKGEEIVKGPPIISINHLNEFKKVHPDAFIKNNLSYAKIKHNLSFEDFLEKFLEKNDKLIKDMSIKEVKIVK